jgi:23S rRNA (guanosine2251-2'-O)-methyltransferase
MADPEQILFGINPVLEKLRASAADVGEIIISKAPGQSTRALEREAHRLGVRMTYANSKVLDRLAGTNKHQGVVARVRRYAYHAFEDLLRDLALLMPSERFWVLFLDGVTDPQNFGALLRTAEAVGIQRVVIPKDRAVGVTPVVVKAASGAVHHMKIFRVANLRRAIDSLKEQGFWIVGLDRERGVSIYERTYPNKLGIVLGSEGAGIRPLIRAACDYLAAIPMKGKVASLNVSVAGAVFFYELFRQGQNVDMASSKR